MPVPGSGPPGPSGLPPVTLAHSSDVHLASWTAFDLAPLQRIVAAGVAVRADVLLLAGDVFDHNRVALGHLREVADVLAAAAFEVVILPGNHDCLGADSVYTKGPLTEPPNVHVIGVTHESTVAFDHLGLAIWGRPHNDYEDMSPLGAVPGRTHPRQVVAAHGHWYEPDDHPRRSWLIRPHHLAAVDADYVALGHWDATCFVGAGVRAHYSGQAAISGTINVVRFSGGEVDVSHHPVARDLAAK